MMTNQYLRNSCYQKRFQEHNLLFGVSCFLKRIVTLMISEKFESFFKPEGFEYIVSAWDSYDISKPSLKHNKVSKRIKATVQ